MYEKFKEQKPYALLDTSKYPPEVAGRFNSFIVTQFDDSLSVEMQMRSIIKWAIDNFKDMDQTYNEFTEHIISGSINPFIEFLNDLIEYMNEFIDTFDEKYQETVLDKMQEWYDNGELETLVNESLDTKYHKMDNRLSTQVAQNELELKRKANHAEVFLKGIGIDINDLNEDLRRIILDMEPGEINAVLGDYNVKNRNVASRAISKENLDFIDIGKNHFDGNYRWGYLNPDGMYTENENSLDDRAGLIRVEPNTTYTISKTPSSAFRVGVSENVILHPANTKLIFDDKTKTSFTYQTTNDERFLVVYVGNVTLAEGVSDFLQVEIGSEATRWQPYKTTLVGVTAETTSQIVQSKNIWDGSFRQGYLLPDGYYYEVDANPNVKDDRTVHMRVKPNTTYTISKTPSSAFRVGLSDKRIVPTSVGNSVILDDKDMTEFTFTTNNKQSYLAIYLGNVTLPEGVSDFLQVEEGDKKTEWYTKGDVLKNPAIPYFNTNSNDPNYFGIVGDGITDDSDGLNNYAYHLKEQGGGRLELPRKELLIKKTVTIPSNTIVDLSNSVVRLGNGYNLGERVWRGGSQMNPYFVTEDGSENIVFKNFSIVGNKQDIRRERHVGLGVFDSKNVDVQNVNVKSINYNPLADPEFGNVVAGIGLFIIRSEDVTVTGGAFDEGGYENIGTEHSKDIIIDGVHSGRAWRTSIQPHRATENLKILNSTIYQVTDTADSGAMTLHGQDDINEGLKNILISGNTIHGEFSTEPTYDYNALIQIMDGGTAENIKIVNNILKGNRTGIYGTRTDGFSVVGNNISLAKGDGIYIYQESTNVLLDQNIVSTLDGSPLVDSANVATLGTNIGF